MSAYSKVDNQQADCMLSMEEVMQYAIHGKPQPIKFRRASQEFSKSFFENWQKPLPFHSLLCKEADMNADGIAAKRKCPLEAGEEHTVASCSSHECLTRPCTCPDPGKSREMCVIKKVENWLLGKCLNVEEAEEMEAEGSPVLRRRSKSSQNGNKKPVLVEHVVTSLPSSVLLRQVEGAMSPVYILNVRVLAIQPVLTDTLQLVRGHCTHYTCSTTVSDIVWTNAGPLNYGKIDRPYCPECSQTRRKRYLNLYFHLELLVEDSVGQVIKILVTRDVAVRFFGCTVYRYVLSEKRRLRIKKNLEALLQASNAPRTAPVPGITFDVRIIPVAVEKCEEVELHMFGDNLPLFQLVKKLPKALVM